MVLEQLLVLFKYMMYNFSYYHDFCYFHLRHKQEKQTNITSLNKKETAKALKYFLSISFMKTLPILEHKNVNQNRLHYK